tara:strand:+ start:2284 stop:2460 length:177 start_codon:yes stop_codon:yes gene_type:complete
MFHEDWLERVRRRKESKIELRLLLGEDRPKPSKIDLLVNQCITHPLGKIKELIEESRN